MCVGSPARNQTVLFTTTCGIFERKFSSQLSKSVVTNLFTPWGQETQPSIRQGKKQGFKCSHAGHLSRHETDWDVPKVPADETLPDFLACLPCGIRYLADAYDRLGFVQSGMQIKFMRQPWQMMLIILASWVNRQQQQVIESLRTENAVLKEKFGKQRILLTDDQRHRMAETVATVVGRISSASR